MGVGTVKITVGDDEVYEAVDANLAAGHVVIPSTTATESGLPGMKVSGDAALNTLGVVINNCITAANRDAGQYAVGPTPMSEAGIDFTIPDATSTVYSHFIGRIQYTAAVCGFGDPICSAAAGCIRKWVTGTDNPAAIIGWCAEPGGVSSAGGFKKARINR